jgi:hypothetical protein
MSGIRDVDDCHWGVQCGYWWYLYNMSSTKVVHRFLRCANINSGIYNRIANRFDPFENTRTILKDPNTGRTLTLIGTTNSSTTLALRTKQLLEESKPDAVYVQASPTWWNYAKHVDVCINRFRSQLNSSSLSPLANSPMPSTNLKTIWEVFSSALVMSLGAISLKGLWVLMKQHRTPIRFQSIYSRIGNPIRSKIC